MDTTREGGDMEDEGVEEVYFEDEMHLIPTEMLEHMYYIIWTELMERGALPKKEDHH